MEGVVLVSSFWQGKTVLITGHTGFKGGWLSIWLKKLGATVIGYSLEPSTELNLFEIANVSKDIISVIGDIRNDILIADTLKQYKPDIVFHMAAQPLVRESYQNPVETFSVNVLGTACLLQAVHQSDSVRVVVNVTTDKVYNNKEWVWPYRETDSLGGHDPYSASKACAELVTDSFRKSFYSSSSIALSSVRAGNVIGGGDWAKDRLVPDIINALIHKEPLNIRNPNAIRPWQHVLEPLNGYLMLAERTWIDEQYAGAWNFGPNDEQAVTVGSMTQYMMNSWNQELQLKLNQVAQPHEAQNLLLDCSKAKRELGWLPVMTIKETIDWTVEWYKCLQQEYDMRVITEQQIEAYEGLRG